MLVSIGAAKANLIRANALNLPIANDSVDLVVTSPPYFALRSYQDGGEHYEGQIGAEATPGEFVDALIAATREMVRVLKPSGSIFVNLGDKYAGAGPQNAKGRLSSSGNSHHWKQVSRSGVRSKSLMGIPWRYALRCIDELGLILRAEIIWAKPNGLPESVTDRVSRKHEQWFHFTVSERYYANIDAVREAYTAPPFRGQSTHRAGDNGETANPVLRSLTQWDASDYTGNPLGKIPGSWWSIPTEPLRVPDTLGVNHYAAFPTSFPARFIRGWSPDDGVVLDPFGGTGTTAAVAKALGRMGISIDLSADYLRIADWRCNGDGHAKVVAKVHGTKIAKRSQVNDSSAMRLFEDSK
jgi:DNA modification methylase